MLSHLPSRPAAKGAGDLSDRDTTAIIAIRATVAVHATPDSPDIHLYWRDLLRWQLGGGTGLRGWRQIGR